MSYLRTICFISLTAMPVTAVADFVGVHAGIGVWQSNPSGDVGITPVDLESTLGFDEEDSQFVFVAIEHPVPVLPNVKLQYVDLTWSGDALITAGTILDDQPFIVDEVVDARLDISHLDATFYYEVLDNIVDLDIGLTARIFDGEVSYIGDLQEESVELDAIVPLAYGSAGFNLPLTGWSVSATANWMNVDEFTLIDWAAELQYDWKIAPALELGVIVGYREMQIELKHT